MSPVIKRKGERFTLPSKYLLLILTILCTLLMLITFGTDMFNRPLNSVVGYVVVPFQQGKIEPFPKRNAVRAGKRVFNHIFGYISCKGKRKIQTGLIAIRDTLKRVYMLTQRSDAKSF